MPDPNRITEGLAHLDYPSNFGNNFGGYEFPDSLAADYMGGINSLFFSGKDAQGQPLDNLNYPSEVSGNWGPNSPLYGLSGFIYMPVNNPPSPATPYYSGWGRLYWNNYNVEIGYRPGCPNLRSYFQLPRQDKNPVEATMTGTGFRSEDKSITSIMKLNILDLISEGPIEGLVTGDYVYNLSGKKPGDIGYTSYAFAPYTNFTGDAASQSAASFWKASPETRSIFWNDTPIATQRGFLNFQYAQYKFTNGQPNIHTISSPNVYLYEDRYHWDGDKVDINKYPILSSYTKLINEQLYGGNYYLSEISGYATPRRYYIYDTDIQAIKVHLKINALYIQNLTGTRVGEFDRADVRIEYRLYRLFNDRSEALAISEGASVDNPYIYTADTVSYKGKIQTPTLVSYTIWLRSYKDNGYPFRVLPNQIGWVVDIAKTSAEPAGLYTQNSVEVSDLSLVYMDRFAYPNAAMVYSSFDARYFANVPDRSYHVRLLKIKIPENYDPIGKTYSGIWNGKFKLAWSDNPAWCFYDMVTNNRFGLGKYLDPNLVDKWSLYEAAKYCDQLVPDGNGGLEPRFTCNLYIANKAEAYKVLNDMASVFNALPYYMAGQIFITQDRPKDPIYIFNNSNVINGEFVYSDSSRRNRRSVAIVRYNDENNNYKPALEYVEDKNAMLKYGIREVEVAAFGGTRKSQARRLGRWFLASENLETETVNFDTAIDGSLLRPGDVVKIYDQNRRNKIYAGRTLELTTGSATLDIQYNNVNSYILTGVNKSFIFSTLTPSYNLYPGTNLGNEYLTGYNVSSDGISGLNSKMYRKTQIQNIYINNTNTYVTSGTGNYSNYVRLIFDKNILNNTNGFSSNFDSNYASTSGEGFVKTFSSMSWDDTQIHSNEGYLTNVFAKAQPAKHYNHYTMFGLNTDPNSISWTTLDYAWYFVSGGGLQIRMNGGAALSGITWTNYNQNSTYEVNYDGTHVNFLSGNQNIYRVLRNKGERLYFDAVLYNKDAGLSLTKFGTYGLDNDDFNLIKNTIWAIDVSTSGDYGGSTSGIYNRYPTEYVPGNILYDGWYLESYLDQTKSYRVVNIAEKENNTYNISCLEYSPEKYYDIDTGVALVSVLEKNPTPDAPRLGLQILYRDQLGNLTGSAGTPYNSYQTKGLNSIQYLITGAAGPNGSGIVNTYKVYVSSGLKSFSSDRIPPDSDLLAVYPTIPENRYIWNTNFPPYFTPVRTGDYYVAVYAENNSRELSIPGTGQLNLSQQTIPAVVITSGVNVL